MLNCFVLLLQTSTQLFDVFVYEITLYMQPSAW